MLVEKTMIPQTPRAVRYAIYILSHPDGMPFNDLFLIKKLFDTGM